MACLRVYKCRVQIVAIHMQNTEGPPGLTRRGGRHKPIRGSNILNFLLHRWLTHFCIAPRTELEHWISYYWHLGFADTKIADHALDHFNRDKYGLRYCQLQFQTNGTISHCWILVRSLSNASGRIWISKGPYRKRLHSKLFQRSTRFFEHDFRQWEPGEWWLLFGKNTQFGFPSRIVQPLCILNEWLNLLYRKLVNEFLRVFEPEAVEKQKRGLFKRRRFWSAGVMEYWSIDQHDKWGRFGLWLHLGIDPYAGQFAWLKVWWCNQNPRLLIHYYLEAGRKVGGTFLISAKLSFKHTIFLGIPLLTMSDPGRENNGIANMHTLVRHKLDPSLRDTLQHRFCPDKKNIKAGHNFVHNGPLDSKIYLISESIPGSTCHQMLLRSMYIESLILMLHWSEISKFGLLLACDPLASGWNWSMGQAVQF